MQHVPRSCSIELAAAEPHLDGLTTAGGREGSFQHICGASDGNREVVRPFRGPGAVSAVAKTSCSRWPGRFNFNFFEKIFNFSPKVNLSPRLYSHPLPPSSCTLYSKPTPLTPEMS